MRKRKALRLSVDIGMTVLLFVLMAYQLTGQFAHEWAGAVMLVLFAAHHLLNRQWFLSLGKGKYAPLRVIQTAVDALLLAGRCASATFLGHSAGKSMGNMMALGCAAGAAAALCVKTGVQPRELDAMILRETLQTKLGVTLFEVK